MALHVLGDLLERQVGERLHRETASVKLSAEDATRRQRERRTKKSKGVLAALAAAGVKLSSEQRAAIERVLRLHPELESIEMSPPVAVERLIAHGIVFTDEQLSLVVDEGSVSGIRAAYSKFETAPSARTVMIPTLKRPTRWARWMSRLQAMFSASQPKTALANRRTLRRGAFDGFESTSLSRVSLR
jgi:hypothetical protein